MTVNETERIQVRVLRADEWEVWRDLRLEALAESPDAFGETSENAKQRSEEGWQEVAASAVMPDQRNLIAEYDGCPVGMALVRQAADSPTHGNLYAMWVSPAVRGRGVGRALVETAVAWAKATGIDELTLNVTEGNEAARQLYVRSGFVPIGEREPLRPGAAIQTELMALRVGRRAV